MQQYQEMALDHNETYGHEYTDWCEKNDLDPDDDSYWDDYAAECSEHGYIEIVEADPDDEDDSMLCDGFVGNWEW